MARIEDSFLISTEPGTDSGSVYEIATPGGAESFPHVDGFCKQTLTDPPLTQAKRLEMVAHAQALADYFEAEYRLFWTLWTRDGGFEHRAAYDLALANFHKVCELRDSLKKGIKQ